VNDTLLRLLDALTQEIRVMETHERTNRRLADETQAGMHDYFRGKEVAFRYCQEALRRVVEESRIAQKG
jgi:hypothetical protein